ncbi:MAG: DUF4215 domain-containing protein [Deltaproteobacteria bacterium]|nr:DUF4215 domain-containing protein [Deltaproteobacteria bacterium]
MTKKMSFWQVLCILSVGISGCSGPVCGDGQVAGSETCDDGNQIDRDGCSLVCEVETGWTCGDGTACDPVCGDGITVDSEVCDPTDSAWTEYCSSDCTMTIASCGDGVIQSAQEECDDENAVASDGCNACHPSFGWTCDAMGACDASTVDPSTLLTDLTDADKVQLCGWMNAFLGGTGYVNRCGSVNYTVNTVADCAAAFTASGICTVGELEAWTAQRAGACDFFMSTVPIC